MKSNLANDLAGNVCSEATRDAFDATQRGAPEFDEVYRLWFHDVCRWVRAFGGLEADVNDLAQEVFLVVRRKLQHFDGNNLPGWLYRISQRTVGQHRRSAWIRRFFQSPASYLEQIVDESLDPEQEAEREQARRMLKRALGRMSRAHRTVFILYEIEGVACEEIAHLEGCALNTIYTRLYHSRREFAKHVSKLTGGVS